MSTESGKPISVSHGVSQCSSMLEPTAARTGKKPAQFARNSGGSSLSRGSTVSS